MDFAYSAEQQALQELARDINHRFDEEYWQKVDLAYRYPGEFWSVLTQQGVLGLAVPQEYGGAGLGLLDLAIMAEALAESGCGLDGGGLLINGPVFGGFLLEKNGTRAQKERYLPGIVSGEMWAGAFTEPNAGSNISAITTAARREGDRYVVKGGKTFISLVAPTRYMVMTARTEPVDPAHKTRGVSLLYTEMPNRAVEAKPFKKLGGHFMDTNAVYIDDLEVPAENIIGEPGRGWPALFDVLNAERVVLGALCLGTGLLCLRRAAQYARERVVWGDRPIGSHQGIQFPLAEASMQLAAARLKLHEAAWLYDRGSAQCGMAAAMGKYLAAHAALAAADRAIQTFGGAGYVTESGIERHWRNLRLYRIAPVTDEMVLSYVAQHHLDLPRSY